ncbi:hypothetical protein K710_0169 [Streptococcus iniae SF1]|nr:hypothetical protein K710_0169 [Streptococcus iniae SF1]EKB52294.1 hypothetical protein A0G_0129 [Streptococcus iniae 9117]
MSENCQKTKNKRIFQEERLDTLIEIHYNLKKLNQKELEVLA